MFSAPKCNTSMDMAVTGRVFSFPFVPVEVPSVMVTSPTLNTIMSSSAPPAAVDVALLTIERALFTLYTSQAVSTPQSSPVKPSVVDKPVVKLDAVPFSAKKKRSSSPPLAPAAALVSPSEATFGSFGTLSSSPAFTDLSALQDVPLCIDTAVPTILVTSPSMDDMDVAPSSLPVDLTHLTIESARFTFYANHLAVVPQAPSLTQATEIKKDAFKLGAVPVSARKKGASPISASLVTSPAPPSEEPCSSFGALTSSPTFANLADVLQDAVMRVDTPIIMVTSPSVEDLSPSSSPSAEVSLLTVERVIFTFHTLQAASPAPAPAPRPAVAAATTTLVVFIGAVPLSAKRRRTPLPVSAPALPSIPAQQTAPPRQEVPAILVTSPSVEDLDPPARLSVNRALLTEERAKWTCYVRHMSAQRPRGRTATRGCVVEAVATERRRRSANAVAPSSEGGARCAKPAVAGRRRANAVSTRRVGSGQ